MKNFHEVSENIRRILQQAFVPILVADDVDPFLEIEAVLNAGLNVIEFTLRRPDARRVLPEVRRRYPDLTLLAGSVLDSEKIVAQLSKRNPQLCTVEELMELGVDGIVSVFDFSGDTYARYRENKVMIPACSTPAEAFRQVEAGAHFVKILSSYEPAIAVMNSAPAFHMVPVFVTGGMSLETIPVMAGKGLAVFAAGFDVIGGGIPAPWNAQTLTERLRLFADTARKARNTVYPGLDAALRREDWMDLLPWPVRLPLK